MDLITDNYPELTPFQYASNDQVGNVDVDGLEGVPGLSSLPKTTNGVFIANSFSEVVVSAAKPTTAVSVGKAFFKGFGKDLWGAVKGRGQIKS